jgi:hypothetical protein
MQDRHRLGKKEEHLTAAAVATEALVVVTIFNAGFNVG